MTISNAGMRYVETSNDGSWMGRIHAPVEAACSEITNLSTPNSQRIVMVVRGKRIAFSNVRGHEKNDYIKIYRALRESCPESIK
jgi:hypothetical protein